MKILLFIALLAPHLAAAEFKVSGMEDIPTNKVQKITESFKKLDNAKGTFTLDWGDSTNTVIAVWWDNPVDVCSNIISDVYPKAAEEVRQNCPAILQKARYLDPNALAVCGALVVGGAQNTGQFNYVQECLENIVNKRYTTAEVNRCAMADGAIAGEPEQWQALCFSKKGN